MEVQPLEEKVPSPMKPEKEEDIAAFDREIIANINMALPVMKDPTERDLESLLSKINQWRLANLLLKKSVESQREKALVDLKDRFLQVFTLARDNFQLRR